MSSLIPPSQVDRFFDEQRVTAAHIVTAFQAGNRQALLVAQMQSGKTGAFLLAAFKLRDLDLIDRVIIICGSDDKELHDQIDRDIKGKAWRYVVEELGLAAGSRAARDAEAGLLRDVIAYKSHNLPRATMGDRTLLIWDESHFAQSDTNRPAKFLHSKGLAVGGRETSDERWAAPDCYFLSVSATPFSEAKHVMHALEKSKNTKAIIRHEPGPAYVGVKHFMNNNQIHGSYPISKNTARFTRLLTSCSALKKYALVRCSNHAALRSACLAAGVDFKPHTDESPLPDGINSLKTAPANDRLCVIGLLNKCRMGKVVPKQHIALVFDESASANTDTLLQSLLGRMCGYYAQPDIPIQIYISQKALTVAPDTGLSEIDRYELFSEGKEVMPRKFMNAKREKTNASDHPLLVATQIPLPADVNSSNKLQLIRAVRDYIVENPYADAIQHAEVLEALTAAIDDPATRAQFGKRDFNAASYSDIRPKLRAAAEAKAVHNDNYESHNVQYLMYTDSLSNTVYFVGYTSDATEGSWLASKHPIQNTTGKEVFAEKPMGGAGAPASTITRIDTVEQIAALPVTAGRHTLWIHNSLRDTPEYRAFVATHTGGRGRPRNWNSQWLMNMADYFVIVVVIQINIAVVAIGL